MSGSGRDGVLGNQLSHPDRPVRRLPVSHTALVSARLYSSSDCTGIDGDVVVVVFPRLTPFLFSSLPRLPSVAQNSSLTFSKIDFVIAWLLRELFALVLFARALWEPDIRWRARTYKLKWGGVAEEVKQSKL